MVSQLTQPSRLGVDERRVVRALPVAFFLRFVLMAFCFGLTGWLIRIQELWTPLRPEADALWFLAAVWLATLAISAASLAPLWPVARFGAPTGAVLMVGVILALDLDVPGGESWLGGASGMLIATTFQASEGWQAMAKRPDLAFEIAIRPWLRERDAVARIEDPLVAADEYRRRQKRAFAWLALISAALLAGLHTYRHIPGWDAEQAAFLRLWNARDLDSLRTWAVNSGYLDSDLEQLAAFPAWQGEWPVLVGFGFNSAASEYFLQFDGKRFPVWRTLHSVRGSLTFPVDWVLMDGEWRIYSLGMPGPTVLGSAQGASSVLMTVRPDLPRRLGL